MTDSATKAARISLEGEMTIFQAATLKDLLLDALSAGDALEVDLSHVIELDTAGVQLMLMLQREAHETNRELRWTGHSHAVLHVLRLLGLDSELGEAVSIVGA